MKRVDEVEESMCGNGEGEGGVSGEVEGVVNGDGEREREVEVEEGEMERPASALLRATARGG